MWTRTACATSARNYVDTCVGRTVLPDVPRKRMGPREQIAELREALVELRERVERLERQWDAVLLLLPAAPQESE